MLKIEGGQWWTEKGVLDKTRRILVQGFSRQGRVICELHNGDASSMPTDFFLRCMEPIPECTGWDWMPAAYPQYRESYMPNVWAFVRLDSPTQYTYVRLDGTEDPSQDRRSGWDHINRRSRLTEAEALARIVETKTIKVHTVAYGYDKLKFVSNVLDTELDGVKRDWKYIQVLKTEEYEVPHE